MKVSIRRRTLTLRSPLVTAWGSLTERPLFELTVETAEGAVGRGEAAPLEPYDGVPEAAVAAALGAYRPVLEAGEGVRGDRLYDQCRAVADLPQALAAVDLALWDLAGQRAGRPVASLLTDTPLQAVDVNATIGATDRASAAAAAAAFARAGYSCVKLKVGVGDDAGRVAAVRAAAGPAMALRLDANGAWDVDEAVRMIEALAPAGLEIVEEPVHGIYAMREVRERTAVRVALDETAAEPGALAAGVADAVCLKVSRAGGIASLLVQASLVRAGGAEPYLASTYDGPLGVAAAVHAAAALRLELPCGLATLEAFTETSPLPVVDGAITVPARPGLGL
ncbi:mandelate racemase/muconate lactonizing enzyme family protein [Capillimicrobium parvum]|uniref:N-succinyl-L-Arg/Lys racemase n=1 Tax=Capillimicrobium parvum TaxID=2884022 RepID=A0A9E7C0C0_9ACTN|nr:mandelate racemase/muconate lactonizing enzyme family protein [Capillimicrobium parvum]UGS36255.1 N-succinyl-L-Arg/Lys racemase [Capillimicrobium parvum]